MNQIAKRYKAIDHVQALLSKEGIDFKTVNSDKVHEVLYKVRVALEQSPIISNPTIRQYRDYLFSMGRSELDRITNYLHTVKDNEYIIDVPVTSDDRQEIAEYAPHLASLIL